MKMEGSNSELIKISSTKTADTGGLTFGPAWLRQLSSGDSTKMSVLPPSPGLTFQLAKHRYGREEMLAIYEAIEKVLFDQPPSDALFAEFEDLLKKDLQRPVLLSQPSQDEQKYLSTCVNSGAALAAYSKLQGGPPGSGGRGGETGSSRGGAGRGGRGANSGGQAGRGSYGGERGAGGRGRGRGRGGSDAHSHAGKPPALDEDGNPIPVSSSTRGGGRGGYSRGAYNRSANWEEREPAPKKDFSRAMADENWRSKASISEAEELDDKDLTPEEREASESENAAANSGSSTDLKGDNKSKKEWRNGKEWSSFRKSDTKNKAFEKCEPHPEWLMDDDDERQTNSDDMQKRMTFDESGKFVPVKEDKNEMEVTEAKQNGPVAEAEKLDDKTNDVDELAEKMTQAVINEAQNGDDTEQKITQNQANLLTLSNSAVQSGDPKLVAVGMDHPEAERWFYLDPQNQIQGSFSSEQMAGWLTAGYFSTSLMVKRGCDEKFVSLGALSQNLGRMPFSSPAKPVPTQAAANSQQWSHEQIQMFQQTQFLPQNFHLLQAYIVSQQKAGQNTANLNNIIQQIQQIQLQQKAVVASLATLGVNGVLSNLNELRKKQEALINQCNLNLKTKQGEAYAGLDPAILDAALPNQSVWKEQQARISPNLNPTPPSSISPMNHLIQGNTNTLAHLNPLMSQANVMLGHHQINSNADSHPIKDKIQALFEITKMEEEKRRKLEKEQQMKFKLEEEERRRQEEAKFRQQQEEAVKRAEEDRVREEMRKEQQKKKLLEIIKLQEEEKKRNEEMKKKKEEDRKKAEELRKQKEELKKLELLQKQQQEEAERRREMEQQVEMFRKQAEFERQKQKLQQEQLNKLKLPSHAQWAKQQASLLPNVNLKSVLEQQALEQKMMEQMKQVEALSQQQNSSSSTWSSLFRGQQQSPPNVGSSQTVSLTNIQTEQKNTEKIVAAAQKSQSKSVQQSSSKQPWTSWANSTTSGPKPQTNDSNEGFWTEVSETKPKQSNPKQQVQVKATSKEPEQKKANKKLQENASIQQKILHNMTISEEFMKWCHDQLKDFQADLHIPTFVNFLREIETCAEIEDYVINYLGESKQAKDFAQQFFINREGQLSQQTNSKQLHDDPSSQFNLREGSFSTKQKQKRRSKGQKLDSQLLGFTVQPDPSLKNRGDIDML